MFDLIKLQADRGCNGLTNESVPKSPLCGPSSCLFPCYSSWQSNLAIALRRNRAAAPPSPQQCPSLHASRLLSHGSLPVRLCLPCDQLRPFSRDGLAQTSQMQAPRTQNGPAHSLADPVERRTPQSFQTSRNTRTRARHLARCFNISWSAHLVA